MVQQLTLYTNVGCPFAHRAEIALAETGLEFTRYEIDLQNKPEWYAPQVNPASKVPALAIGGPKVDPATPSPESKKIAESLVIVDLVNDLSNGSLLPTDPIERAEARFFISQVSDSLVPAYISTLFKQNPDNVLPAIEKLQALLPAEGFALGNKYTEADIAATPFLARLRVGLDVIAKYNSAAIDVAKTLDSDPKYARFKKYYGDLTARESFKKTWKEDYIREKTAERVAVFVQQAKSA